MDYRVVFTGELRNDVTPEAVMGGLMARFHLSQDRAQRLLRTPDAVLQSNLTERQARAFVKALLKIGLVAKTLPESGHADELESPPVDYPFVFTGSAGEYFKIWVVNVLLTIVTLGVYSAWAKVRTQRYFHANTLVADTPFEYLAQPLAILKGRLLALLVLALFLPLGHYFPPIGPLLLLLAAPAVMAHALVFRSRNTAYKNIRFGFDAGYGQALAAFVLWPLAGVLSLGLAMPYALHQQKRFIVRNSRYGSSHFEFAAGVGGFYRALLVWSLVMVPALLLSAVVAFPLLQNLLLEGVSALQVPIGALRSAAGYYWVGIMLVIGAGCLLALGYLRASIGNLVYASASLDDMSFRSHLSGTRLALIYLTNALAMLLTLGLARPWAAVRLARYRAGCLSMIVGMQGLDGFIAAERERTTAVGEEFGGVFEVNIGL